MLKYGDLRAALVEIGDDGAELNTCDMGGDANAAEARSIATAARPGR